MLRVRVASYIRDFEGGAFTGSLTGGIYPETEDDPSVMDPLYYPMAFDDVGAIRPTLLVRDGGDFTTGPKGAAAANQIVDLLLWEQGGRTIIGAMLPLLRKLLEGARLDTSSLYVYRFDYAGASSDIRDQVLGDAEHAWQRWQTVSVVK